MQRWDHHVDFFAAEVAAFAGVGVQPGQQDARLGDGEFVPQIVVQDAGGFEYGVAGDGGGYVFKRQVGGEQRHAQAAAGEHHHHAADAGFGGQIFGVALKQAA